MPTNTDLANHFAQLTDEELLSRYASNTLWAVAIGGARVMVPANHVAEAREVIKAFNNGDLAIGEDDIPE